MFILRNLNRNRVNCCIFTESAKPVSVFQKLLDEYGPQFASRWVGIVGDNHTPRFILCCWFLFCNFYTHEHNETFIGGLPCFVFYSYLVSLCKLYSILCSQLVSSCYTLTFPATVTCTVSWSILNLQRLCGSYFPITFFLKNPCRHAQQHLQSWGSNSLV